MRKDLFRQSIVGFIIVSIVGTLSHFVYEWSGSNRAVGMICPVNESVWEHLKLLFFPFLIWTVALYIFRKDKSGVLFSNAVGIIIGMTATASFYYTYTGIIGKNIEVLDILSFFIGVAAAFFYAFIMMKSGKFKVRFYDCAGIAVFITLTVLFFLFTAAPPFIPLFKDPVSQSYGI